MALLTYTEGLSALQRKVRERQLTQDRATIVVQHVTAHCAWRYHLLAISPTLVAHAGVLARGLRCGPMTLSTSRAPCLSKVSVVAMP